MDHKAPMPWRNHAVAGVPDRAEAGRVHAYMRGGCPRLESQSDRMISSSTRST